MSPLLSQDFQALQWVFKKLRVLLDTVFLSRNCSRFYAVPGFIMAF